MKSLEFRLASKLFKLQIPNICKTPHPLSCFCVKPFKSCLFMTITTSWKRSFIGHSIITPSLARYWRQKLNYFFSHFAITLNTLLTDLSTHCHIICKLSPTFLEAIPQSKKLFKSSVYHDWACFSRACLTWSLWLNWIWGNTEIKIRQLVVLSLEIFLRFWKFSCCCGYGYFVVKTMLTSPILAKNWPHCWKSKRKTASDFPPNRKAKN